MPTTATTIRAATAVNQLLLCFGGCGGWGGSSDPAHADAATSAGILGIQWSARYDAAGNITCRAPRNQQTCAGATPTGQQLRYDSEGRLTSWQNWPTNPTETVEYLYDGEGNRVEQVATTSGTTTTASCLEEVSTTGSSTTTTAYYGSIAESVNGALYYLLSDGLGSVSEAVSAGGAPTTTTTAYYGGAALSVNGALSYLLSDGLGSVTASVSTSSGAVTATQLYSPYGSVRYQSGTLPTSYGFTGQRADAATGLDYYNARYYDPVAGQFTSADTTLAGGLNRYAYVGGNPETFVDPTGNHAQSCDLALCGGEGINLDGSLSSAQGGAPGDASGSGGSGGSSGSRGAGSGESTGETQASASASTDAAESDGMLAGETFSIDPEGVGTPQGLETGEQYHLDEVRQAETKTPDGKNTASPNDASTPTTPNGSNATKTGATRPSASLPPSSIRYSQSSVNGASEIIESMQTNGWNGDPIDVVQMPDGGLTTVDNTRVVAANEAGINVQAVIHPFDERLPEDQVGRFTTPRGGVPTTWGDAIMNRIGGQNATFRNTFPYGAPFTRWKG